MRVRRNIARALLAAGGLAAVLLSIGPAAADNEPVIVVPGRPGVPVMMYGVDVSGAVIVGEWGLNRPGVVAPIVIMPPVVPIYQATPGGYFPATGHRPPYGRLEIVPPHRRLPRPAQPFFREWSSQSEPTPATEPADMPPMVMAPQMAPHMAHHMPHPRPKIAPHPAPHAP
jgi:hypothetical protein